jgi:co-chaperonin GroES (HSP10)
MSQGRRHDLRQARGTEIKYSGEDYLIVSARDI